MSCQSTSVEFRKAPEDKASIGEMVYAIARTNARESVTCSAELEQLLGGQRERLVQSVDAILTSSNLQKLPALMSQSVLPAADDGSLEAMTDALGSAIGLLVDDSFEPDRKALVAIVDLLNSHTILQDQHLLEFSRTLLADPGLVDGIHAISGLSEIPLRAGSEKNALSALLQVASDLVNIGDEESSCAGLEPEDAIARLLSADGFAGVPIRGDSAWVARLNTSGTPQVRINPATNSIYEPFVDNDSDGSADHNEQGRPINSLGEEIDIPPFGYGEGYDASHRKLSDDGDLLYQYYDAKNTAFGHGLRVAGEALGAGLLSHVSSFVDAAMGEQIDCAGEEDCKRYSSQGNPVFQTLFTLLEVAKYDKPIAFLETWSTLLRNDPAVAEDVLVSLGQIVEAIGNSSLDGTSPALYDLVGETLPLIGQIFRTQTRFNTPMPRLLMGLISDLGTNAREFPAQLLASIEYKTLLKENECSAEPPDPNSPAVDFSRPRFYVQNGTTTVDNRSSIEKSLEILATADCGSVPFTGGKTVTHTIIDLMSRLSPETVCNLIDDLLGLLGVTGSIGEAVVNSSLFIVGCTSPDDINASDLFALDDLAKSGALNFYLPVAKTFRQEGELRALVSLFATVGFDLLKDEDQSANTASGMRAILPVLAEILRSGAMDSFFDLNEFLVTIPSSDGDGTLADVLIDSGARLLDSTGTINTASGTQSGVSLASELVDGIQVAAQRIDSANQGAALASSAGFLSGHITQTEIRDGALRLKDQTLVPQLASGLEAVLEAARLPSDQYQCVISEWQEQTKSQVESKTVAALLSVGVLLQDYPKRAQIDLLLSRILDPNPPHLQGGPTTYDELTRIIAELLQSPERLNGASDLLRFASALLDPERQAQELFLDFDKLLYRDEQRVLVQMSADALGVRGEDRELAPLIALLDIAQNYSDILSSQQCAELVPSPVTLVDLEESLASLVSFLRDDDSPLAFVFDLLQKRSGP